MSKKTPTPKPKDWDYKQKKQHKPTQNDWHYSKFSSRYFNCFKILSNILGGFLYLNQFSQFYSQKSFQFSFQKRKIMK